MGLSHTPFPDGAHPGVAQLSCHAGFPHSSLSRFDKSLWQPNRRDMVKLRGHHHHHPPSSRHIH